MLNVACALDAGAWFVNVEFAGAGGQELDPRVHLGDGESNDELRDLYEPVTSPERNGQVGAAAVLHAAIAALFTATVLLTGAVDRTRSAPSPKSCLHAGVRARTMRTTGPHQRDDNYRLS